MLRGAIVCADPELREELKSALNEALGVAIVRVLKEHPSDRDLVRFLRATAPDVIFLGMEPAPRALELAAAVEKHRPGTQVVALSRQVNNDALRVLMRAGIREFLARPFETSVVQGAIEGVQRAIEQRPPGDEVDRFGAGLSAGKTRRGRLHHRAEY